MTEGRTVIKKVLLLTSWLSASCSAVGQYQEPNPGITSIIRSARASFVALQFDGDIGCGGVLSRLGSEIAILTAKHCYNPSIVYTTIINGEEYPLLFSRSAVDSDLSLFKFERALPALDHGRFPTIARDDPEIGEPLVYIGNPMRIRGAVNFGIYLGKNTTVTDESLYEFEGHVYNGNSGGPLFNHSGELVGIVVGTTMASRPDGQAMYLDWGFAVPLDEIKSFLGV